MFIPTSIFAVEIEGSIQNKRWEFNGVYEYILAVWFPSFNGNLPEDITSISVTLDGVDLGYTIDSFEFDPEWDEFNINYYFQTPSLGDYEFTVEGIENGETFKISDIDRQDANRVIPFADRSLFTPVDQATINGYPTFTWQEVHFGNVTLYYRLELFDQNSKRIFKTNRTAGMILYSLQPSDCTLQDGETYTWRIRISDGGTWKAQQNISIGQRISFVYRTLLQFAYVGPPGCYGNTPCYTSVQAAVAAVSDGTDILIPADGLVDFSNEDVLMTIDKDIKLFGGWNEGYLRPNSGVTTLKSLTIKRGSINTDTIVLKKP